MPHRNTFYILIFFGILSCSHPKLKKTNNINSSGNNLSSEANFSNDFFKGPILKFDTLSFPENWDRKHSLRKRGEQVLIWTYNKDTMYSSEWKSCILIQQFVDSLGKENYCISEMYSNEKPFANWNISTIHYAPKTYDSHEIGYSDLLMQCYNHKPTQKEIYDLLIDRFKFKFSDMGYLTIEAGIDVKLWNKVFGFKPTWLIIPGR